MTLSFETEAASDMVHIPGGEFRMGCLEGQDNERPVHSVRLDRYAIGKYPVTNAEYRTFVADAGAPEPPFWTGAPFSDPSKPVVGVDWFDAVAYCEWLSRRTGARYRLPTEAEWERAARGGAEGKKYPWGDDPPWKFSLVGSDPGAGGPAKVGGDERNGYGLCDMSGGVHEWCGDFYDAAYYGVSPKRNPRGPTEGRRRASRGGSWRHRIQFSRCAARSSLNPASRYSDYGFRLAMTP